MLPVPPPPTGGGSPATVPVLTSQTDALLAMVLAELRKLNATAEEINERMSARIYTHFT